MNQTAFLPHQDFAQLFDLLHADGFRVVGPTAEQGAIVYREIDRVDQLPAGLVDHQAPGRYRLEQQAHGRYFDWVGTAQGLKPWLFTPEQPLMVAREIEGGLRFEVA
jgi:hypothetical protein